MTHKKITPTRKAPHEPCAPCQHDTCACGAHEDCACGAHEDCACACGAHEDCACACGDVHAHKTPNKPHIATPSFKPQDPNKGVSLGVEAEIEIAHALKKRYARFLQKDEAFTVKTEVCHHFGLVSTLLTNPARTTEVCVEVCVECEENSIENPMDAYDKALDVLDLVWHDYLDSDRITHYLPVWQSYEIDAMHVQVRLEHRNPSLDEAADDFLRQHGLLENGLSPEDYD